MKAKKPLTNLGVDVVSAQLANSDREVTLSSARKKPLNVEVYQDNFYAFCYDTETYFDTRETLFLYIWERTRHLLKLEKEFVFYREKITDGPINWKMSRNHFYNICPVTGKLDVSNITVHVKNLTHLVELGHIGYALDLFRFISIMQEDLGPFLKYFFQNIFKHSEVFTHLECTPVTPQLQTLIVS